MKIQSKTSESSSQGDGAAATPYVFSQAKDSIASEYSSLLADVEDMIKSTASLTGEELVHAKALISARIQTAKKYVEEMGSEIADQARNAAKVTDSYVHENPWQAIGIGAALGLLLGVVVSRRK